MIPSRSVSRFVVLVHDDSHFTQNLTDDVKTKVLESRHDSRIKDDETTLQALDAFFQSNNLRDKHIIQ